MLFTLLGDLTAPPRSSTPAVPVERRLRPPRLLWEVDLQRVVVVLPAQQLPTDATLAWKIDDTDAPTPSLYNGPMSVRGRDAVKSPCSSPHH